MTISNVISLLGGLALFLYGMQMMSGGLETAAGDKMKSILEKLTSNRIIGVIVGALITAVIQSSSATTVMVVGFVNAGMMSLRQAVWIIMGANIGTTITGQLIALDIGAIAPVIAFLGVVMIVFIKNPKSHCIGEIIAGLGVLFIGMEMMSSAMMPLRESETFISLMTKFSNPIFGIMAGAVFTAVIQSSSASVGILQALALNGLIGLDGAVYVLFGQNIGTCITAVLASIGTNREAKQTTVIHLSFNIIGTVIFTVICMLTPLTSFVGSFTPNNAAAQIANMHTLFNIITTLLLLPFGSYLATFAEKILPIKEEEEPEDLLESPLPTLSYQIGTSAILVEQIEHEINNIQRMAFKNINESLSQLVEFDKQREKKLLKREEKVDEFNLKLSEYITEALGIEQNSENSFKMSVYYHLLIDIERISNYAVRIQKYKEKVDLNSEEKDRIGQLQNLIFMASKDLKDLKKEEAQYARIKAFCKETKKRQIMRMKEKSISFELTLFFSQLVNDVERINEHMFAIARDYDMITVHEA
ncbi:Na/Pi cotransporter family protein [Anaerofustis butyriciformans]|uniref:Na/Pi cotransporter family protein n=1 Tax=Anaerofustis TaxID=264995 RepID=UPI003F8B5A5F